MNELATYYKKLLKNENKNFSDTSSNPADAKTFYKKVLKNTVGSGSADQETDPQSQLSA
jgi:hypothetical protein